MNKSQRLLVTAAAMAGLYTGALAVRAAAQDSSPSAASSAGSSDGSKASSDKHGCKGQNSCKGKGGCEITENDIKVWQAKQKEDAAKAGATAPPAKAPKSSGQ